MTALRGSCLAAAFWLVAGVAAAQTTDPRAQMISPTPGSTLPGSTVTFTWSPVAGGGDYFLQITTVPFVGQEIFYAFVRVESVTLLNLPTNGETVYVYLFTRTKGVTLAPFSYTYKAAGSAPATPAATTTSVASATVGFGSAAQNVALTATVGGGTVNQGTVTFQVLSGATNVGAAVTSAPLTNGSASVSYVLPGGTAAGSYTIRATYSGGALFQSSSGTGTLTVSPAPPVVAATTTSVAGATVGFASAAQGVPLTATVSGGTVNQGTVTFQVLSGATNVGAAVTSAPLTNGSASVSYVLSGGTAAGSYTIRATYSGGALFKSSSGTGTLTVRPAAPSGFAGIVPIVLHVPRTAHYTSELQLTNLGPDAATVRLSYTGSIGSGSGEVLETVPSGQQVVVPDAISYLRSRGVPVPASGSQGGTLAVSSSSAGVRATVRTGADTTAPQPAGHAGLAYSDAGPAASTPAVRLYVYGLRTNAADRSNLALYNTGADPVSLGVTLVSGDDGSSFDLTGGEPLSLPPYGWYQYNGVLAAAGFSSGYAVVERATAGGQFGAYGVVNDQLTNDGSFIPALPGTFVGSRLTVPVLVETSAFESELVLANRGSALATFTLRYFESLSPSKGSGGTTTVQVAAGRQRVIPSAVDFLRSNGVAVGPRGEAGYAGSLQVQVSGVGLDSVFAGARTSSRSPAGGEFGLFTPGIGAGEEFSDQAFVLGLKADSLNRSNVAALHTGADGSGTVTLEFQALDGSSGGRPVGQPLVVTLNPGDWVQPQGFFAAGGVPNGYVRIRRTAGTAPWYAYGVINDGGQPGQRTGDGSYVPGVRP